MGRGGFPPGGFGGGNMQQLLKQAQRMQADLQKAQEELAESVVEGTAGGGTVEVSLTGAGKVSGIRIAPEAVDPEDVEMLEDLIVAAFNDAHTKAEELKERLLGPLAGNMGGMF